MKKAHHLVIISGCNGKGDQAILKREDGTFLGVEGPLEAKKYKNSPHDYVTVEPDSYIWQTENNPNFMGLGQIKLS